MDSPYLRRLAEIESGMNPLAQNPRSSAKGMFQFINSTGQQYGLDPSQFGTEAYTQAEIPAAEKLTQDNRAYLTKALGREPTAGELYLAHQQGAAGAAKILANPQLPATQVIGEQAVLNNGGNPDITSQEFANQWIDKFNSGYQEETPQEQFTQVETPDGIVEFPSSMTDDQIAEVLRKEYPAPVEAQPQLTPAQDFNNEHPILRTLGRTGRAGLAGLSSLADLGLLVPKTAALAGGMALENMGASEVGNALQRFGATPTMADTTRQIIDKATGGVLQPTGTIDKIGDFAGEMISSAVPFAKGADTMGMLPKAPGPGEALKALMDPQTALNQLPKVQAQNAVMPKTALLPLPKVTDEGKEVAKLAKQYDIPLGMDDLTDSKAYRTMISEGQTIPFSGAQKRIDNQLSKFTRAVSKSIGLDTDKLTVEAIDDAFTKVGKEFDDLVRDKTFVMNDDVTSGFNEIKDIAEKNGFGADGLKLFNEYLRDMTAEAPIGSGREVSGATLSKLRAKLNAVGRRASDQNAKALANELESTISDFITDGSPEALKQAKYRYKNLIAIEPLAAKDQLGGQISPAQLLGRVRQVYKRQFSRGKAGELGDLANIGQYIKESIPNSGTSQRTGMRNFLTGNIGVAPFMGLANPVVGAIQGGTALAGLAGNRALQSRNFDQDLLDVAIRNLPKEYQSLLTNKGALAAIAGTNTAVQKRLPPPPLRITVRPNSQRGY